MNFKIYKSPAKINLFLKMVGEQKINDKKYFELFSRFLRVDSLYDEISFKYKSSSSFQVFGDFNFPTEENIIFKTYLSLSRFLKEKDKSLKIHRIEKFFQEYGVTVEKNIPQMAGLGGGSSNSATFLNAINEILELNLSIDDKLKIVSSIGSDIQFFLYEVESANVYGRGEIIQEFKEKSLEIEVFTPKNINCNTGQVYKTLRTNIKNGKKLDELKSLEYMSEKTSLELFPELLKDKFLANDLFSPAIQNCEELKEFNKDGFLFSGSGSSFFRIKN